MGKVFLSGKMVESILEHGFRVNNMESEFTIPQMIVSKLVNGWMGKEQSGVMIRKSKKQKSKVFYKNLEINDCYY